MIHFLDSNNIEEFEQQALLLSKTTIKNTQH